MKKTPLGVVRKSMFTYYAGVGLLMFVTYLLISLILSAILGKIINKKFTFVWVVLITAILFYFLDLIYVRAFISLLAIFTAASYLFKKFKK